MTIYKKSVAVGQFAKKGQDIKDGDIITLANEGKKVEGQFGVQDVFLVKTADGRELNVKFNKTSLNNMVDAYGENSTHWVGKTVKVWLVKGLVSGKMQSILYLSHPEAEMSEDAEGFLIFKVAGQENPVNDYPVNEDDGTGIPF